MLESLKMVWPPKPKFTEKELPDQSGKVFIVTGASSGLGQALAQILYTQNAKVYVAVRSEEKANKAIDEIKANAPKSKGELVFLRLDLGDLTTIKRSVDEFLSKETKLDVLWNNAGVMTPPPELKTTQGYELQIGTNNVAPFLFTKLLTPILIKTAKTAPEGSVRVVWVASSAAVLSSPPNGIDMDNLDYKVDKGVWVKYGVSKAGNVYHATEYAKIHKDDGIISVALNPGNLRTNLQQHMPSWQVSVFGFLLYPPVYGAYTELYAGLSPDLKPEDTGAWLQPWGRIAPLRADLEAGKKSKSEGGTGIAKEFWDWSEKQVAQYV